MGNTSTTEQRPIHAQERFVGTMNPRFVRDRMVTLELVDQFMSASRDHEFEIRDVTNGQVVYKVAPISNEEVSDKYRRRQLLDAYGVPVVGMLKTEQPPRTAEYTVIPGGPSSKTSFCSIVTYYQQFTAPLRITFVDPASGNQAMISTIGTWAGRDTMITISTGQNAPTYGLARVYCTGNVMDGVYRMDIAPGVDTALMVLIAAVLDEHIKKHETTTDRAARKTAAKRYEKEMKKKMKEAKATQKTTIAASA